MKLSKLVVLSLALTMSVSVAQADTWPQKPIRIIVPFPAGSPGDTVARLMQPDLSKVLGQAVVIDNKPGAGGNLGTQEAARATDGHTFLIGPDSVLTIGPYLYKKLGFKPDDDLTVLTQVSTAMLMLVCHPGANIKSVADFSVKAKAENLTYASGGQGSPSHMAMELLSSTLGLKLTHVAYKGPSPAAQDLLAGLVPCAFLASNVVGPYVKDGKLVALGVSSLRRATGSPQVPTLAEAGVPGFDASFFELLIVPKSTPSEVAQKLQQAVLAALAKPETRARMLSADLVSVGSTATEALARTRADADKWGRIAAKLNLQLD